VRERIIAMALDVPELSPRELAICFTDSEGYFVSESCRAIFDRCGVGRRHMVDKNSLRGGTSYTYRHTHQYCSDRRPYCRDLRCWQAPTSTD
jgi:hypothetical protein